jgi:hypothetical protein
MIEPSKITREMRKVSFIMGVITTEIASLFSLSHRSGDKIIKN